MEKRMPLEKNISVRKPTLPKIGPSLFVLPNIESIISVNTKEPGKLIKSCHMIRRSNILKIKSSITIESKSILQFLQELILFIISTHLLSTKLSRSEEHTSEL